MITFLLIVILITVSYTAYIVHEILTEVDNIKFKGTLLDEDDNKAIDKALSYATAKPKPFKTRVKEVKNNAVKQDNTTGSTRKAKKASTTKPIHRSRA